MVTPTALSEIDRESLAQEQIRHIRLTAADFFRILLARFGNGIGPEDILKATSLPSDGSRTIADLERLTSFAPINIEAISKFVAAHEIDSARYRSLFYEGFGPNWSVILRREIAELDSYQVLEPVITKDIQRQPVIVISGEAGCGKSTFVLWSALRLSQKHSIPVYQYLPKQVSFLDAFGALARYIGDRDAVVVVDDLYLYAKEVREIVMDPRFRRIHILTTARSGEWASRIGFDMEDRVRRLDMPRFSHRDVDKLIVKIDNFYPAPRFSRLPLEEKRERFKRSKEQLLIALKEATYGAGFDQIIEDELGRIEDTAARHVLVVASICTLPRTGVSFAAATSVFKHSASTSSLTDGLRRLSGIVEVDNNGRLRARHELYARHAIESYVGLHEYEDALVSLISYFSKFKMPVIKSVSQVDGRLFKFLLNNRNVYDAYDRHGALDRAPKLYERFEVALQQDGHFWLQYALLLRRLRKQKLALRMLERSLEAYPQNPFAVHALAQQKLIVATFSEKFGLAEQKMTSESVEALLSMHSSNMFDKSVQFDEYPIVTLAYWHVNLLVKHGRREDAVREAKTYFAMLDHISSPVSDLKGVKSDLMLLVTNGKWVRLQLRLGSVAMEKVPGLGRDFPKPTARRATLQTMR
ncbi:tetratricopeptide repeat protein [Pseudaminobacter sp. 19-2017]|uniref:Tetratricopeptide repeat protein n=1 Tax=Pseudaminobacter soli (ex Zhang et al. 2022) TaxID=2831468 RepID=A0A942E2B2_9HYPH|nr:tetratricopeptide repeat protein [Pseudaminobacter soli]MBS3649720.1 tetratricopeptide repeat protein [Pseudaminobacter soli]